MWDGSFLAQFGEAETCAERSFLKSFSPRTFPPETCAERSFSKCFSPRMSCPERLLAHVTSRNLREMATRGGPECQFAHVTSQDLREMASSATIARREARDKVTLRTRFHQKLARREALQKVSLHTGFSFARLCQKGTFPHAPRLSPSPSPPYAIPPPRPHTTHASSWARGHTGPFFVSSGVSTGGHP